MRVTRKVKCPYCTHVNVVPYDTDSPSMWITTCGLEEGGCDQKFAVSASVFVQLTPYAIEGERKLPTEKV